MVDINVGSKRLNHLIGRRGRRAHWRYSFQHFNSCMCGFVQKCQESFNWRTSHRDRRRRYRRWTRSCCLSIVSVQAILILAIVLTCRGRYGAAGVWVGTRFVASEEAGAPPMHKKMVVTAGYDDTERTIIYTGRPLRVRRTPYVVDW